MAGVQQELHSDEGCNFKSRLIKGVLQPLGVSRTPTIPLHPQSDGMVERYIKTVKEHP
jgi:transposase